jgi:hypothetical protein
MRKYFELFVLATALLLLNAMVASALTFTGDVGVDFASLVDGYAEVSDPVGDVGMPMYAPPGAVSGWEIETSAFYYDVAAGVLYIGLDAYGIAGDVDGNGTDGNSAQWLLDNGGVDYADLMNSESMGIAIDFDQDGTYDYIGGVSAFDATHKVCMFSGFPALPFMAFGAHVPMYEGSYFYNGLALSPDYEMALVDADQLLVIQYGPGSWSTCFDFLAFGGSFEDDGVGEEYVFGEVCLSGDNLTGLAVPAEVELTAFPNPFNPSTSVSFSLTEAGPVSLNVYNLAGQMVSTLVDANLPAGDHQCSFYANDLPSGVYIAQINTATTSEATRLVLLK